MKKIIKTAFVGTITVCIFIAVFLFSSCNKMIKLDYYSKEENYITARGTLVHIQYSDDFSVLYLGFSDLDPVFADTAFKIVGDNLNIARKNGIDEKLEMDKTVEFITAPRYWGDGFVYPIVAITVEGETLLEFEEGFPNFLEHLKTNE